MKQLLAALFMAAAAAIFFAAHLQAQNIEGQIIASQFGEFQVPGLTPGALQFSPASCQVSGGGKNFPAFSAGVPIKIVDANPALNEIDTPTAVFITTCAVSMATTHLHSPPFYLTSGTGGLQEAINNGEVKGGGQNTIILNQDWYGLVAPGNPATVIASVHGNSNMSLVDVTVTPYNFYTWNGTQYVIDAFAGGLIPSTTLPLCGTNAVGAARACTPGTDYVTPSELGTLSVVSHGALCNWNGTTGSDDSAAFQATLTAAGVFYAATGTPVKVGYPTNCTLGTSAGYTTINIPSGVTLDGSGGSIFVPAGSANPLFESLSAGATQFNNNNITFVSNLSACAIGVNNAACAAYRWDSAVPGTSTTYNDFTADNNVIYNSGWGILVGPQDGTDCLQHIHVNGNTIANSPGTAAYSYNDAIHLGGCLSNYEVNDNIIQGRHDAGIAVTTELNGSTLRQCQDGVISGNTIYENMVGIDVSGCSNVQVTGNWVWADIAASNTSNPAFRAIFYNGLPQNVNVSGNTFQNYQGTNTDFASKFDCGGGCGNGAGTNYYMYSSFTANATPNMYIRGSYINIAGNTFSNKVGTAAGASVLDIDWDSTHGNGSNYIMLGPNTWMNSGNVNTDSRSDVYFGSIYAPQTTKTGSITEYYPNWAQPPDGYFFHATFNQLLQNIPNATPTIAVGAGAGTGATVNIGTGISTDQAGTVFVNTGTSPVASATVFTVTLANYNGQRASPCILSPANAVTAALVGAASVYIGGPGQGESVSGFYASSGAYPLAPSTSYEWTWLCIG
jgi:parallel beta-helix repeat protein